MQETWEGEGTPDASPWSLLNVGTTPCTPPVEEESLMCFKERRQTA